MRLGEHLSFFFATSSINSIIQEQEYYMLLIFFVQKRVSAFQRLLHVIQMHSTGSAVAQW